jgi:hypothetical protein
MRVTECDQVCEYSPVFEQIRMADYDSGSESLVFEGSELLTRWLNMMMQEVSYSPVFKQIRNTDENG